MERQSCSTSLTLNLAQVNSAASTANLNNSNHNHKTLICGRRFPERKVIEYTLTRPSVAAYSWIAASPRVTERYSCARAAQAVVPSSSLASPLSLRLVFLASSLRSSGARRTLPRFALHVKPPSKGNDGEQNDVCELLDEKLLLVRASSWT